MATPLYPRTLTAYPTPVLGRNPAFFHQNDRKGCKRNYLDARGYFVLPLGAIGDKPLGSGNLRLRKTRVKIEVLVLVDGFMVNQQFNRANVASKN